MELLYNKSMEKAVQILINSVREEIGEFLGEINGPKEEKARDKMITGLLGAVHDAELDLGLYKPAPTSPVDDDGMDLTYRHATDPKVDAHYKALGKYYNEKLKKYEEDMSSAEITAEAEATYGQLHN